MNENPIYFFCPTAEKEEYVYDGDRRIGFSNTVTLSTLAWHGKYGTSYTKSEMDASVGTLVFFFIKDAKFSHHAAETDILRHMRGMVFDRYTLKLTKDIVTRLTLIDGENIRDNTKKLLEEHNMAIVYHISDPYLPIPKQHSKGTVLQAPSNSGKVGWYLRILKNRGVAPCHIEDSTRF